MTKIINVLNSVNRKTENKFYRLLGLIFIFGGSALFFFTGNEIIVDRIGNATFGSDLIGYGLHTMVFSFILIVSIPIIFLLNMIIKWFRIDLANAFKEAIRENYNIKPKEKRSKSTIRFE